MKLLIGLVMLIVLIGIVGFTMDAGEGLSGATAVQIDAECYQDKDCDDDDPLTDDICRKPGTKYAECLHLT